LSLSEFLTLLFAQFEDKNVGYAVLREYVNLPNTNQANDIDILVDERSLAVIEEIINSFVKIKVAHVTRRAYVQNYYLRNVIDGGCCCLQLDFVFNFERYGIRYIDVDILLDRAEKYNGFNVLLPFDQALVLYLSKLIIQGSLKPAYRNLIHHFVSIGASRFIDEVEMHVGLKLTEIELILSLKPSDNKTSRLIQRKILLLGLFKQGVIAFYRYIRHLICEARIMVSFSSKKIVYITNPETLENSQYILKGSATVIKVLETNSHVKIFLNFLKPVRAYSLYFVISPQLNLTARRCATVQNADELVEFLISHTMSSK
jgi:hypothetical protein